MVVELWAFCCELFGCLPVVASLASLVVGCLIVVLWDILSTVICVVGYSAVGFLKDGY